MNWFSKLKLSQDLFNNPKRYTDVGHYFWEAKSLPKDTKEILWLIDKNWKLHTKEYDPTDSGYQQMHATYFKDFYFDSIASGRAVLGPKGRVSSLKLMNYGNSSHQREFLVKKVGKIIERAFKLDNIHVFDL